MTFDTDRLLAGSYSDTLFAAANFYQPQRVNKLAADPVDRQRHDHPRTLHLVLLADGALGLLGYGRRRRAARRTAKPDCRTGNGPG